MQALSWCNDELIARTIVSKKVAVDNKTFYLNLPFFQNFRVSGCVNLVVDVDQCDAKKEAYRDHVLEIIWHFTTVCVLNVTMVLIDHWRFHTLYS